MTYSISFLPAAQKALSRLPKQDQKHADKHILALANDPRPRGWR